MVSARHPASQHVRHLAQLEIRAARIRNNSQTKWKSRGDFSPAFSCYYIQANVPVTRSVGLKKDLDEKIRFEYTGGIST